MKFKLIPAGTFTMGSSQEEIDHFVGTVRDEGYKRMLQAEGPEHVVEITKPFYMGTTEVTVGQFRRFVEANPQYEDLYVRWKEPGFAQTDNHPVVWVSWYNAFDFCKWLSEKEGQVYRLPTEAEWEYCCRAGTSGTRYCYGDDEAQLENYAWYVYQARGTRRVGRKKPNDWGLYDMHGNVWEWCQDRYDPDYYKQSAVKDPTGPDDSLTVVQRGGSWDLGSMHCRSAFRSFCSRGELREHRGFRVLLVAPAGGRRKEGGK
jgi:formylglycine-generating enzyme required for sulfatase activity